MLNSIFLNIQFPIDRDDLQYLFQLTFLLNKIFELCKATFHEKQVGNCIFGKSDNFFEHLLKFEETFGTIRLVLSI